MASMAEVVNSSAWLSRIYPDRPPPHYSCRPTAIELGAAGGRLRGLFYLEFAEKDSLGSLTKRKRASADENHRPGSFFLHRAALRGPAFP